LAKQGTGRHRADVDINVLETMELRSRRSIREAERKRASREEKRLARKAAKVQQVIVTDSQEQVATGRYVVAGVAPTKFTKRREVRNVVSMLFASGFITTVALPAYAYSPDVAAMARFTTANAAEIAAGSDTQNLTVAAVNTVKFDRGTYESASAAEIARQQTASRYLSYSGPTAADFVSNPPYSKLDAAKILEVAAKYTGTPYVFGGENPNGFDCSGYVRFVFAQFGIDLPHSVIGQARVGMKIKPEDAQPGDIVVLNDLSHDGIYAGNGNFYHAPRPGDTVKLAPIFTSNVFFIRFGTK
jgi:cell wall-associated NlpC family hydrolase